MEISNKIEPFKERKIENKKFLKSTVKLTKIVKSNYFLNVYFLFYVKVTN